MPSSPLPLISPSQAVLRAWLPLSEAVLGMAVDRLPGPAAAAPSRMPRLLGTAAAAALTNSPSSPSLADQSSGSSPEANDVHLPPAVAAELLRVEQCLSASSASPDAPLVVFVSKMVSVPASLLPRWVGG